MNPTRRRGILAACVLPALALAAVTAASAYWAGPGGGYGSARTGTPQAVVLSPGSADAQLYPGAATGVRLRVTNPGAAEVRIGSLALDTSQGTAGFAADAAGSGCTLSALSFTTQTNGGAGWTVPAGGAVQLALPASLAMSTSASNACQGAGFTVYLRAGP